MTDIFRTLIVPDSNVADARAIASGIAPVAGDGMWTTPCSASGQLPATHWISSGMIGEEWQPILPLTEWALEDGVWMLVSDYAGQPQQVYYAVQQAGLSLTLADVQDLFDLADVTEQEPFTALERLGLRIINTV